MFKKIKRILYRSISGCVEISYETAIKILKNNVESILLDVRSPQEYSEGHLLGAINISLYDIEYEMEYVIPNKNTIVITYCASGSRSRKAIEVLNCMGYENIYQIKGGLDNMYNKLTLY